MTNKFFERHVFFCTNQRPEGHPKGCCASKNSTVLRAYMKKKTKELNVSLRPTPEVMKLSLIQE